MTALIEHDATHDPLTGVLNRTGILARLDSSLVEGLPIAMHYVDLDEFKPVNDRLGHRAGDAVLTEVARRLVRLAGGVGHAGRLGGDEFAVVTHVEGLGEEGAIGLSRKIVSTLRQPIDVEGERVRVGASVGSACAPLDGADSSTLMRNADVALYRAKQGGRNRAVAYGP